MHIIKDLRRQNERKRAQKLQQQQHQPEQPQQSQHQPQQSHHQPQQHQQQPQQSQPQQSHPQQSQPRLQQPRLPPPQLPLAQELQQHQPQQHQPEQPRIHQPQQHQPEQPRLHQPQQHQPEQPRLRQPQQHQPQQPRLHQPQQLQPQQPRLQQPLLPSSQLAIAQQQHQPEQSQPRLQQPLLPSSQLAICNQKTYIIKEKEYILGNEIGRGGSSRVYEAKYKKKIYAIKVVDLENVDKKVFDGYMDEVKLLKDLQGQEGIIQLEDYELKHDENGRELLVVMERGENDFQTFLRSSDRSPNLIRYYWESMLMCVKAVHTKNIVHSDLKPANFIFVKNKLKLIDFGIASSIPIDVTSIPKDSQAGTLNYMSPESIQLRSDDSKVHIPLASDIWSLGCILYLMVYGSPPFGHITSQMAKMNAILYKDIEFPPIEDEQLLNVMQQCLQRKYQMRPTVAQLLEHPYLRPNTLSSTFNTANSNLISPTRPMDEDSITFEKIVEQVGNNTPRTAAKNVLKMFKTHSGRQNQSELQGSSAKIDEEKKEEESKK